MRKEETPENGLPGWFFLVPLAVTFIALFGLIWVHVQCTELKTSIHKIRSGNREQEAANRKLEIELTRLKSPERLRRLGETELGLQNPNTEKIQIIDLRGFNARGGRYEKTP